MDVPHGFLLLKINQNSNLKKLKANVFIFAYIYLRDLIIDPTRFRKVKLPVSGRVEYCIVNIVFKCWNAIVLGYTHKMFKPSLCKYITRSQVALDIPLQKINIGQKTLSFLVPKI